MSDKRRTDSDHPEGATRESDSEPDGFSTRRKGGLENLARSVSQGGATTLFQPGAMIDSILEAGDADSGSNTWVLHRAPQAPQLQIQAKPYFLVLGAPPGFERIPITAARTVFGRDDGDVRLDDPSVSSRHFQLDVVGHEFFVKDLGSRNGTRLNGHDVRYSELLPGDEIHVGESVLIFRLEGDEISDRPGSD